MSRKQLLIIIQMALLTSLSPLAKALPQKEIGAKNVFVIPEGFDDNDNIQIVVDGTLPNVCYKLANPKVNFKKEQKLIQVIPYAHIKKIEECSKGMTDQLDDYLNWPLPYSKVINLGQLAAGDYTVQYKDKNTAWKNKGFKVGKASTETTDDYLYAPISNVFTPETFEQNNEGKLILTGVIGSSCLELFDQDIKVIKYGNVFVVLPILKVLSTGPCQKVIRPIHKIISLGSLKEGRYLIHVRSMTGQSINKTFTVLKERINPRSNMGQFQ